MAEFKEALKVGQQYEKIVLKQIQQKYPKARILVGYNKSGDIYIPEIKKYIEVKSDLKSNYTQNIVVEVAFNGEPSALSTTESWYWVFVDGEMVSRENISAVSWDSVDSVNLIPAMVGGSL